MFSLNCCWLIQKSSFLLWHVCWSYCLTLKSLVVPLYDMIYLLTASVDIRWQQCSTQFHSNNTQNNTTQQNTSRCNINKTGNVRMTQHWGSLAQSLLPWGKQKYQKFWVCVCNLSFPERNAHILWSVLYCNLWLVGLYHIFAHYLISGRIFGNTL